MGHVETTPLVHIFLWLVRDFCVECATGDADFIGNGLDNEGNLRN